MQTATVDEYNGVIGKVTGLSPDGTIADVYNVGTGRETWVLSLCSPHIDYAPKPKVIDVQTAQPIRVAMGPIVGAILIANLISGVIGFIVLLLTGVIH